MRDLLTGGHPLRAHHRAERSVRRPDLRAGEEHSRGHFRIGGDRSRAGAGREPAARRRRRRGNARGRRRHRIRRRAPPTAAPLHLRRRRPTRARSPRSRRSPGSTVTVVDHRPAYLTPERFPPPLRIVLRGPEMGWRVFRSPSRAGTSPWWQTHALTQRPRLASRACGTAAGLPGLARPPPAQGANAPRGPPGRRQAVRAPLGSTSARTDRSRWRSASWPRCWR